MDENLHGVLHGIQWIMFHVLQDLHQAHLKGVGLTQNLRDCDTPKSYRPQFIIASV